ncbi:MAG: SIMPL domain-containing protein [Oscillospiraceae bacterium]|nr:SIMPL domain-containing protein [Oscillospiraceae bacterium]
MRTITVKGIGNASAKPDYVQILINLESIHFDYEFAMKLASKKIEQMTQYLAEVGFEKDSIKTTNFQVDTDYSSEKDVKGNYRRVFNGYRIRHNLKLAFDFDAERLSHALGQISRCNCEPQLNIRFTVKDPTAISEQLLANAAENARRTAEILCTSSGAKLGALQEICYNWVEVDVYSRTEYDRIESCKCMSSEPCTIDFTPDDIETTDTASFVWEII